MRYLSKNTRANAIPIIPLGNNALRSWVKRQSKPLGNWIRRTRFKADPGAISLVAGSDGELARVLFGTGPSGAPAGEDIWEWASLAARLPEGLYRVEGSLDPAIAGRVALGWALGTYAFSRYRDDATPFARLVWPANVDRAHVERTARAIFLARDLINTPASDMGPRELAQAARSLARKSGARCRVIKGEELIRENYPAIHAVGRASAQAPRLIDIRWGGRRGRPKLALVGKGVCFDSGGLDLKPAAGMALMKKDMSGAAHALALAGMVMEAKLPVSLRVLVPAVENSVSGNAFRPGDVVATRKGTTVEIGNTDAEGRVILADALCEAASERPDLIIEFATLTGSARVALGTELPALFCNDDATAEAFLAHAAAEGDPLWRMPLWDPYRDKVKGKVADLTNAPEGGYGGAITAALFLREFVDPRIPWAHIDFMAWNLTSKPGRPEGAEAMGLRAAYALIRDRFGK
jgi:leucyl aminopeptidase